MLGPDWNVLDEGKLGLQADVSTEVPLGPNFNVFDFAKHGHVLTRVSSGVSKLCEQKTPKKLRETIDSGPSV